MLRSLLTTTALAALVTGGAAVAQTDQSESTAPEKPAMEGQATTQTQSGTEGAGTEQKPDAGMSAEEGAGKKDEPASGAADSGTTDGDAATSDTSSQTAAATTGFVTEQDGSEVLASKYIGQTVVNGQDESVGKINDLVMDEKGKVTAAVIGVGGFLGVGEKEVGVPIEAIEVRTDSEGQVQLVMQSTREELESAPAFVDLEEKMEAQEAARQDQERQQMMNQGSGGTTAPSTGTQ